MSTDNSKNECFAVTIPVTILVDASDESKASYRVRTELQKLINAQQVVWPFNCRFKMGDSTIQKCDWPTAMSHIGALKAIPSVHMMKPKKV